MCEFFSSVLTQDGRLLFTETDSHETIIRRAGLRDDREAQFALFIRLEAYRTGSVVSVFHDNRGSGEDLPQWAAEQWTEIRDRVTDLYCRIEPYHEEFVQGRLYSSKRGREKSRRVWKTWLRMEPAILGIENSPITGIPKSNLTYAEASAKRERVMDRIAAEAARRKEEALLKYIKALRGIEGYVPARLD